MLGDLREEAEEVGPAILRLPILSQWSSSVDVDTFRTQDLPRTTGTCGDDVEILAVAISMHCKGGAEVSDSLMKMDMLREALIRGGHDAAERACASGAIEASFHLLQARQGDVKVVVRAVEALWHMVDDYDSCQRVISRNGNQLLCKIARDHGPENANVAGLVFRLLAETLYSESRSSPIWSELDGGLVAAALVWALDEACSSTASNGSPLGFVCDVAALWMQRAGDEEAVKPLIGVVPKLLKAMSARLDDALLMQHGFRLLWAFAQTSTAWPEAMRQPAVHALEQMRILVGARPTVAPNAVHYNVMALKAISQLVPSKADSLDSLD
mmetsp:Transcript_65536/g.154082  ORF Transcript_65536/g.154082 Transcript_65536/m.154082 type:complete len:327 (+) Transcript_65536:43-1023(+)